MASEWVCIRRPSYIVQRGDVLTLRGARPEDVVSGESEDGYVIGGAAGAPLRAFFNDYEGEEPRMYQRKKAKRTAVATRLALHKTFSKPLPLP